MGNSDMRVGQGLFPGGPLWGRVPTRDSDGKLLNDFMMLIPRFSRWPLIRQEQSLQRLQQVFEQHDELVEFVDLNTRINLLWVSLKVRKGGCERLVTAVREAIPEAVLVASQAEALQGVVRRERRWRRYLKLPLIRLLGLTPPADGSN